MKKPDSSTKRTRGIGPHSARIKATEELRALVEQHATWVASLGATAATGDIKAFTALIKIAELSISEIRSLTKADLPTAIQVARRHLHWPTMVSARGRALDNPSELVDKLQLGKELHFILKGDPQVDEVPLPRAIAWHLVLVTGSLQTHFGQLRASNELRALDTPDPSHTPEEAEIRSEWIKADSRRVKRQMEESIDLINTLFEKLSSHLGIPTCVPDDKRVQLAEDADRLPPLSPTTRRQWIAYGWKIVLLLTDKQPEQNVVLRPLGESRQNAYYWQTATNPDEVRELRRTSKAKKTEQANIRYGIFKKIQSAYTAVTME